MALIIELNEVTEELLREIDDLAPLEKQSVLAYVRALNLKKSKRKAIAKPEKGLKPLTLSQIDKIKHQVRKEHAHK